MAAAALHLSSKQHHYMLNGHYDNCYEMLRWPVLVDCGFLQLLCGGFDYFDHSCIYLKQRVETLSVPADAVLDCDKLMMMMMMMPDLFGLEPEEM